MYIESNEKNVDLHVHNCGYQECPPELSYGPAVREFYLFHYIISGFGIFQTRGQTFNLSKGQGFLIHPKILSYYKADKHKPWTYAWIGITGLHAEEYLRESGLDSENPIWTCEEDDLLTYYLLQIVEANNHGAFKHPRITGYAYLFLSRLMEISPFANKAIRGANLSDYYIRSVIEYIEQNFYRKLTIKEIAQHVGLERSYLGSIFKKQTNKTLQEFLIDFRIRKACNLLKYENINVADVARSVGYEDQLQFSKIFKSRTGLSPVNYRKTADSGYTPK